MRPIFPAVALFAALGLTPVTAGAEVPVIDPSVLAKAKELVASNGEQLSQLMDIFNTVDYISKTIGKSGIGDAVAILKSVGIFGDEGGKKPLQGLAAVQPVKIETSTSGATASPGDDIADDVQTAKTYTQDTFYTTETDPQTATQLELQNGRALAVQEASISSYAVALHVKQEAAASADRLQKLSEQVTAAKDMRSDVAANSAILLAILETLSQQTALQAASLEAEAAQMIAQDPLTISAQGQVPGQ